MECTQEQKLKGTMSLLRDKAYRWSQAVARGTQAQRLTWENFLEAFQNNYVSKRYVEICRLEFIELKQRDRFVAEYEVEFLQLSCYTQVMVTTQQDKCDRFENGLRYELMMQVVPLQERVFETLVEKTKIVEEVKRLEREMIDKARSLSCINIVYELCKYTCRLK